MTYQTLAFIALCAVILVGSLVIFDALHQSNVEPESNNE